MRNVQISSEVKQPVIEDQAQRTTTEAVKLVNSSECRLVAGASTRRAYTASAVQPLFNLIGEVSVISFSCKQHSKVI